MAITISPTLNKITPFDATQEKVITFSINGLNIVPKQVIVTIRDNLTNEIVYNNTTTISIGNLTHTIINNKLNNGNYYNCFINIVDKDGNISPSSNTITFFCISNPIFEFTNILPEINISSLTAILRYEQTSSIDDPLNSYIVNLYNSSNNLVYSSNTIYVTGVEDEKILEVRIDNLEENNYTIEAVGETINGLIITAKANFTVNYDSPGGYSSIILENLYDKGQIKLTSNIVGLDGEIVGEEIYIDDTKIDLSDPNSAVIFDKGFLIENNFYIKIWMTNIIENTKRNFIEIKNTQNNYSIKCYWRRNKFKQNLGQAKSFVELITSSKYLKYVIHSNYLDEIIKENTYFIGIKKQNNIYQVHIEEGLPKEKGE